MFRPVHRPIYRAIASSLLTRPGGFNPSSLFNDGSIGVLYDNNDLSTFFSDSAGTTAAVVNGPVGLQLDKSAGLVLGAETLNGTGTTSGTWAYSSDVITRNGSTTGLAQSSVNVVAGKTYLITFTVSGISGDTFFFRCGGTASGNITANGSYTYRITATSASSAFQANPWAGSAGEVTISGISVKELAGNHRYQATTGSKPVLRGTPTGSELFTAYGTPGAGWSVAGATGTATTASSALPTTTASAVGKFYRVTYTVTRSAGSVQLSFGGRTGVSRSAAGQYVEYFDNALNTNALTATGTSFTGTVRIDEVKDVSAGSVTAPYGLQYDGVDDFLQTASVNFTATDKMFVCAGVRKLSDASRATLFELANNQINAFRSEAPYSAGPVYNFGSGGSAGIVNAGVASGYAAPITNVLTGIGNISGDVVTLRLNGVEITSTLTDQGTGNYQNGIIYFGRRGGVSQPLNGLDFGFVIVGKSLTASQIASTERWMAQRTGVSI